MKTDSLKYKIFLSVSFFIVPFLLLTGVLNAADRIKQTWSSFIVLCTQTWNLMIGYIFHFNNFWSLIVIVIFGLGLLRGVIYLGFQIFKTHQLKQGFNKKILSSKNRVKIVNDGNLFALTAGFIKPEIYLSYGLFNHLTINELRAVIAHERYHQKNLHPLYILLVNVIKSSLFFFPVLRKVASYISLKYEVLADTFAISKTSKATLSSALYKIISQKYHNQFPATVATFSVTKDRVNILSGESMPSLKISKALAVTSLVTAVLLSPTLFDGTTKAYAGELMEGGMSQGVPVDCYSPAESIVSLVTFGQQSDPSMTYSLE